MASEQNCFITVLLNLTFLTSFLLYKNYFLLDFLCKKKSLSRNTEQWKHILRVRFGGYVWSPVRSSLGRHELHPQLRLPRASWRHCSTPKRCRQLGRCGQLCWVADIRWGWSHLHTVAVPQRRTWCTEPRMTRVDPDACQSRSLLVASDFVHEGLWGKGGSTEHQQSPVTVPMLVWNSFCLVYSTECSHTHTVRPTVLIPMISSQLHERWPSGCSRANVSQSAVILCALTF